MALVKKVISDKPSDILVSCARGMVDAFCPADAFVFVLDPQLEVVFQRLPELGTSNEERTAQFMAVLANPDSSLSIEGFSRKTIALPHDSKVLGALHIFQPVQVRTPIPTTFLDGLPIPLILMRGRQVFFGNIVAQRVFGVLFHPGLILSSIMDESSAALLDQVLASSIIREPREIEVNINTASGVRSISLYIKSMERPHEGLVMLALKDITEGKAIERTLRQSELRYRYLTENIRDVIWTSDIHARISYVSPSCQHLLGYHDFELMGKSILDLVSLRSKTSLGEKLDPEGMLTFIRSSNGRAFLELEQLRKDGMPVWIEMGLSLLYDEGGRFTGFLGVSRDISERKQSQQKLGQSEEKFRFILERLPVPIMVMLHDWSVDYFNAKFVEIFGYTKEEVPNVEDWWNLAFPDARYREEIRSRSMDLVGEAALRGHESTMEVMKVQCRDGNERIVEARFIYLIGHGIWVMNDVTESYQQRERLRFYATTDELTGIHNRRTGITILTAALDECIAQEKNLSICFLDINNLKHANDKYGHQEGDDLLKLIVGDIKTNIRRSDTLCRVGGDEFLIIFPDCTNANAEAIIRKICDSLDERNTRNEKPYPISFSWGIEMHRKGQSVQELVALADRRMYTAKRSFHKDDVIENDLDSVEGET